MEIKIGVPVSPGIAIATAQRLDADTTRIPRRFIRKDEVKEELEHWDRAKERARAEIEEIRNRVKAALVKDEVALIFETHQRILDDPTLDNDIRERIRIDRYSAEHAVLKAFRKIINAIKELPDSFFGKRDSDFVDVQRRLIRALTGTASPDVVGSSPQGDKLVIVAHDLTPSQTATLSRELVAAFVTDLGGSTSHTAIIANALKIPAVVGLGTITNDLNGGETVIVDGARGRVIINPDEATRQKYEDMATAYREREARLVEAAETLKHETADGVPLTYLANIEFDDEVEGAMQLGASGLGLYRTEFLFARHRQPTEEHHYQSIVRTLKDLGDAPLVLRTLDLGADKFREEIGLDREENPFLGNRSIRLCLTDTRLFHTQLRAVLRASTLGDIRIMLPMVGSIEELRQAKAEIDFVKQQLKREGIPFDEDIKVGIMIEVPSAVMVADALADECDFFSIGTNDLVQYTLAVDRNNPSVGHLYQHTHPAVLHLIKMTIDAAARRNIPVTVCGEMAGDPLLAVLLLGLGLRSFSVAPSSLPMLKTTLTRVRATEAERIANEVLKLSTVDDINALLSDAVRAELGPDIEITGKVLKLN